MGIHTHIASAILAATLGADATPRNDDTAALPSLRKSSAGSVEDLRAEIRKTHERIEALGSGTDFSDIKNSDQPGLLGVSLRPDGANADQLRILAGGQEINEDNYKTTLPNAFRSASHQLNPENTPFNLMDLPADSHLQLNPKTESLELVGNGGSIAARWLPNTPAYLSASFAKEFYGNEISLHGNADTNDNYSTSTSLINNSFSSGLSGSFKGNHDIWVTEAAGFFQIKGNQVTFGGSLDQNDKYFYYATLDTDPELSPAQLGIRVYQRSGDSIGIVGSFQIEGDNRYWDKFEGKFGYDNKVLEGLLTFQKSVTGKFYLEGNVAVKTEIDGKTSASGALQLHVGNPEERQKK